VFRASFYDALNRFFTIFNKKIINMSNISGKIGFLGLSPYVASKHAINYSFP
jgi:NAD(P)-dependent dehydrogenase (short-subunit alcohol dehydrogenase family)